MVNGEVGIIPLEIQAKLRMFKSEAKGKQLSRNVQYLISPNVKFL